MGWFILKHIFSTILSIINTTRLSNEEKDLEILILRQQLSILQRKHNSPIKPNRVEKITLAVLTARLKRITHRSSNQLRDIIRIFQPETILRWHRELVRRKWTYLHKNKGGRLYCFLTSWPRRVYQDRDLPVSGGVLLSVSPERNGFLAHQIQILLEVHETIL